MRNTLREKLENGEILLGTQSFLGSKEAMEILGALGYDFVFICAEHPAVGTERMFDLVKYCEWAGTPALVRLPIYDPTYTKKVLDGGVSGVLFPMIKDVSDAEKAMDLCLYPPNGKRGFGPMSAVRWGLDDETAFVQKNADGTVRMIQIEHIGAVECIDKLAENPWIDAFIFGPNDLAASMGHINDMYHPDVQKAIRKAVKVLSLHNKRFGVSLACTDAKKIAIWKDMEMNIFSIGADFGFLRDGALAMKAELKSLLK